MALYPHIAFAEDQGGYLVSAVELLAVVPATYRCVACRSELVLRGGPKTRVYFAHAVTGECLLGAQRAVRAAALQVLGEARFICAPSLKLLAGGSPSKKQAEKSQIIEEWSEGTPDWHVDGVDIDFFAQALSGSLVIELSIPGLFDSRHRERVRALGLAALEVALPKPTSIHTIAELRGLVLRGLSNKQWLHHPALEPTRTPLEERLHWDAEPAMPDVRGSTASRSYVKVARAALVPVGELTENIVFRQASITRKIELLEAKLGVACDKWPDELDIPVTGQNAFAVDRRLWQADTFGKFIRGRDERHQTGEFSSEMVVQWLSERYGVEAPFENAEKIAVYYYLHELSARGFLHQKPGQRYSVVPLPWSADRSALSWNPRPTLSASRLRTLSNEAHLTIPIDVVQWLLDTFDDAHPAVPVDRFAATLAAKLRAPARSVVAFLLDAGLVHDETSPGTRQSPLF